MEIVLAILRFLGLMVESRPGLLDAPAIELSFYTAASTEDSLLLVEDDRGNVVSRVG